MPLPVNFAALAGGTQPLSLFDQQFAALAVQTIVPCTAVGTNAVTLTPFANTSTVLAYANYLAFTWVQPATTTGPVTIGFGALAQIPAYKNTLAGPVQLNANDLFLGGSYIASYNSALNAGSGGLMVVATSYGTMAFQNASAVAITGGTITGITITGSGVFTDAANFKIENIADPTKVIEFSAAGITTGTTRTLTAPDASGTIVLNDNTATLTNKTFDTAGAGNVFKINGTGITAVTGAGSAVLATAPAISAAVLTGAGSITGSSFDNGVIGGSTPAAITGTTITANTALRATDVGSGSTSSVNFTTSGGTFLRGTNTASQVNFMSITGGATGNPATFACIGADASVGLNFGTKNTGEFNLYTSLLLSNHLGIKIVDVASAVNYTQFAGAAAGSNPIISMQGSDTNIYLGLSWKGTASIVTGAALPTSSAGLPTNALFKTAGAVFQV